MGETSNLFKKIRDTKGIFHAKIVTIKDRNGMDLTEAEDTKKGCKNTQKNYTKQVLMTWKTTMVWSLTQSQTSWNVSKWALGIITMNKASGSDVIPVELFQILKDDAVKVLQICQQIWKTQQWPQDWKRSVFIPIPKKGKAKECSNYRTIALISHTSKVTLKILQPGFSGT